MIISLISLSTFKPSIYGFTGETPFFEIGRSLKKRGHKVNFYSLRDNESDVLDVDDIKIHRILPWYFRKGIGSKWGNIDPNCRALYLGLRYIFNADSNADIFQIQHNPIPFLAKMFTGRKLIYDVRAPFTLMQDEFSRYNTKTFFSRPSIFMEQKAEKIAYSKADHITVLTSTMKRKAISCWKVPREKITVIQEGVNADLFKPNTNKEENYTIVYEGSITPFRGIETLLKAFRLVKRKIRKCKLLIIGGSSRSYLDELANKIQNLGLYGDVEITGYVPYTEVPKYLCRGNIGVSPIPPLEAYKVSFPLKILEYLSMGLPIVATEEIPIHKDIIKSGKCGVLASNSSASIARAILSIYNNKNAAEMGLNGRKLIESQYTWDYVAKKFEDVYLKVESSKKNL